MSLTELAKVECISEKIRDARLKMVWPCRGGIVTWLTKGFM